MQPLVQSAIDAANRGENSKALELCKQALTTNPNDVDAWLVIAAVVEQPERKRQCLNRVLSIDPRNQIARDELLDMDRAAMGGASSTDTRQNTPVSSPLSYSDRASAFEDAQSSYQYSPSLEYPTSASTFESTPAPQQSIPSAPQVQGKAAPKPSPKARPEKPLVFRYPLFWRVFMYIFLVFFGCVGLIIAIQNIVNSLPFFGMAFVAGLVAMIYSPKVEITEAGIRASGMFSHSEAKWNDIKSMKSSGMKQRLELVKKNGEIVKVSSQVSGYARIVEILRQKRPDLFGMAGSSASQGFVSQYEQTSFSGGSSPVSAAAFAGLKEFKKSFFRQYGYLVLVAPLCLVAAWTAITDPENRLVASIMFIIFLGLVIFSLFQVTAVKVEPNRLTLETLFEQKVFSARQIKDIKWQSVRGRYGIVTHFVIIVPVEGKKYSVSGFSAGEEVMYGFLTNWWNAYKNR